MQNLEAFGKRVAFLRTSRKLTQEELASKTSLHRTYISSVERGKRNVSLLNLIKIQQALDVSFDALLGELNERGER